MPVAVKFSGSGMDMKTKSAINPLSMLTGERLTNEFFIRDVLEVAPEMIGKNLVVRINNGEYARLMINDVEAYRGAEDKACHASKGRTPRTEIMFHEGGHLYIYLIYGMYWMLNVVVGPENVPQAILVRGAGIFKGPGVLTKSTGIDNTFYGENLVTSERIWIEDTGSNQSFKTGPRIGIDYSGDLWKTKPWRYYI